MKRVKKHAPYFFILLAFLFYLITLPHLVALTLPCLQQIPGQAYTSEQCVLSVALDRFLLLALVGFAVSILYVFLHVYPRSLKKIGLCAILLAIAIVVFYHRYIPESEKAIRSASIILYENP